MRVCTLERNGQCDPNGKVLLPSGRLDLVPLSAIDGGLGVASAQRDLIQYIVQVLALNYHTHNLGHALLPFIQCQYCSETTIAQGSLSLKEPTGSSNLECVGLVLHCTIERNAKRTTSSDPTTNSSQPARTLTTPRGSLECVCNIQTAALGN